MDEPKRNLAMVIPRNVIREIVGDNSWVGINCGTCKRIIIGGDIETLQTLFVVRMDIEDMRMRLLKSSLHHVCK